MSLGDPISAKEAFAEDAPISEYAARLIGWVADKDALIVSLLEAGDRMATEVENRWSGRSGCDCAVCASAKAWREVRGSTTSKETT